MPGDNWREQPFGPVTSIVSSWLAIRTLRTGNGVNRNVARSHPRLVVTLLGNARACPRQQSPPIANAFLAEEQPSKKPSCSELFFDLRHVGCGLPKRLGHSLTGMYDACVCRGEWREIPMAPNSRLSLPCSPRLVRPAPCSGTGWACSTWCNREALGGNWGDPAWEGIGNSGKDG